MIYHFFKGNSYHLSYDMIENVLSCADDTNKGGRDEHFFVVYGDGKVECEDDYRDLFQKYHHTQYLICNLRDELLKKCISYGKKKDSSIVLHGSLNPYRIQALVYLILLLVGGLKRTSLICWGEGDYSLTDFFKKRSWILRVTLYWIFRKMRYVATLSQGDVDKCKKIYGNLQNIVLARYYGKDDIESLRKREKKDESYNFLVSHSGWVHNCHLESFALLSKFKDENITITCPLCYGDNENIKTVIEKGNEIFGEKFHYFTELLTTNEYLKLIGAMDFYVSGARIQTGLFAASRSLVKGCKVFVRDNLYESLQQFGYTVYNYDDLKTITYDQLIQPLGNDIIENNIKAFMNMRNYEDSIKIWKKIYATN